MNLQTTPQGCQPGQRLTGLYVRVSTSDQSSGLEAQVRTLKEFCEKNKITNFELFADEGISGAKSSRPGLDRLMSLVREGKVEKVVAVSAHTTVLPKSQDD